jgi:hypothetical protein
MLELKICSGTKSQSPSPGRQGRVARDYFPIVLAQNFQHLRQNNSTIDHAGQGGLFPLLGGDERSPDYLDQALLLSAENVGKNQITRYNPEG